MRYDILFRSSVNTDDELSKILELLTPEIEGAPSSHGPSPITVPLEDGEKKLEDVAEKQLLDLQEKFGAKIFQKAVTNVLKKNRTERISRESESKGSKSSDGQKVRSSSGINKNLGHSVKSEENDTSYSIPGSSGEVTNAPKQDRPSAPTQEFMDPSDDLSHNSSPVTFINR